LEPLSDFKFVYFDQKQTDNVLSALKAIDKEFNITNTETEIKESQVDIQKIGDWNLRIKIANRLKILMSQDECHHYNILVPSTKNNIDVSACNKARGFLDWTERYSVPYDQIVMICDSFKLGGSDLDLLPLGFNGLALHVGRGSPINGVYKYQQIGPKGTTEILAALYDSIKILPYSL